MLYKNTGRREISMDKVIDMAPAVSSSKHHPDLSTRYVSVSTLDVVESAMERGFRPVQARQANAKAGNEGYASHLVAMCHESQMGSSDRPELIIMNSHNGRSSVKIYAGYFREVCSNGLVVGSGVAETVRHIGSGATRIGDHIDGIADWMIDLPDRIGEMKGKTLGGSDLEAFCGDACSLRWDRLPDVGYALSNDGLDEGVYFDVNTMRGSLRARRSEDKSFDLWTVYNRVQENLIKGGPDVVSVTKKSPEGRVRASRGIRSIDERIRVNRGLWDLAVSYV